MTVVRHASRSGRPGGSKRGLHRFVTGAGAGARQGSRSGDTENTSWLNLSEELDAETEVPEDQP
jgi:hypothetical protein